MLAWTFKISWLIALLLDQSTVSLELLSRLSQPIRPLWYCHHRFPPGFSGRVYYSLFSTPIYLHTSLTSLQQGKLFVHLLLSQSVSLSKLRSTSSWGSWEL